VPEQGINWSEAADKSFTLSYVHEVRGALSGSDKQIIN